MDIFNRQRYKKRSWWESLLLSMLEDDARNTRPPVYEKPPFYKKVTDSMKKTAETISNIMTAIQFIAKFFGGG